MPGSSSIAAATIVPPRHRLLRVLAVWIIETLGLLLASWLLAGVSIDGAGAALAAVAVIGVLNAVLYPAIASVLASIAPLAFVALALVLNAALVLLVPAVVDGFRVSGVFAALATVFILTLVNTVLTGLLAIDDDHSFQRGVVRRQARRRQVVAAGDDLEPGVVFLEVDGLAEPVLRRALREGYMPHMTAWIDSGDYVITAWECDLSSQTSASQAGLLLATNENIPAFRWYDRELGRPMVSSSAADTAIIEARASDGDGLLADGGASRGNLLSGDAPRASVTLSVMRTTDRAQRSDAVRSYLGNPYNLPRTILVFIGDVISELWAARRQRRRDVRPRIDRGGIYPLLRAGMTGFIPEMLIHMVVGDVLRGVPSIYATFVSYDEIAHHSGVLEPDALGILRRLDSQFARVARAAADGPRPYEIVVLSDHGQTNGATFLQRYGETLEDVIRGLTQADVGGFAGTDQESMSQLDGVLGDIAQEGGRSAEWVAGRARRRVQEQLEEPAGTEAGDEEILVFASGNLGIAYFTAHAERPTLEAIADAHPRLVKGLAQHEGIGFVAGLSSERGPIAAGAGGIHELESGRVVGTDPLAPYGRNAARHVLRELGFANAPDLLMVSTYWEDADEVAAFEELVGSHGGLGGDQGHAFILHPTALSVPDEPLIGARAVHEVLKSWVPRA